MSELLPLPETNKVFSVFISTWIKYSLFWFLVIPSALISLGRGFMNPGGTFISFSATILAAFILIGCAILPLTNYRQISLGSRIIAITHSGVALIVLWLMVTWTWSLFETPYNRGYLFGW
jgi:hypothetical protein